MAVAMMMLFALGHRNDTPMGDFADYVLELDGCVVDAEVVQEAALYIAEDAFAD
jgi:hypothetical protein